MFPLRNVTPALSFVAPPVALVLCELQGEGSTVKRGAALDLAAIDLAIEQARVDTLRKLERMRKPARYWRRVAAGKVKPRKPWVPRRERWERLQLDRAMKNHRRDRMADKPLAVAWSDAGRVNAELDQIYGAMETRGQAEARYCGIRELVAAKLDQVAAWAFAAGAPGHWRYRQDAERLRRARRDAWFGQRTDTGELVVRFRDRSGLTILDPSEARERQAVYVRRLVPAITQAAKCGLRAYYAVFSEPNVPSGSLAWGKRHLFERFKRVMLSGAVPEIVGAFASQEDPLAGDGSTWNVHLNVILLVDPKRATPLAPELVAQLEMPLPGQLAKLPTPAPRDRAPPGALSYTKLHFLWGAHQVEVRPLKGGSSDELARSILEVVKYSAKWVSSKQLDELAGGRVSPGMAECVGKAPSCSSGARPFELDGARHRERGRPLARGVTEWPEARVAEWIEANRRFRRARSWGLLFRLADEREPDPDDAGKIRWLGRIRVTPRGAGVWITHIDSTHGVISGAIFRRSTAGGARAGPPIAEGAAA